MTDGNRQPNRKRIIGGFKIGVSALLLFLVWWRVGSDADVAGALRGAHTGGILLAVVVFAAGQAIAALRLHYVLLQLHRRLGFPTVLRAHFVGIWFNQLLPTGFGGDIVKVLVLRRRGDTLRVTRAVLLARAFGLMALLAASILLVPFYGRVLNDPRSFQLIALASLIALGGLGIAVLTVRGGNVTRRVVRPIRFLMLLLCDLDRPRTPRSISEIVVTSAVVVFSVALTFMILGRALGHPIGLLACMVIIPPIIVSMHLPLSYGGWGIREVGAVALLPLGGVPEDIAFLMSVLYGLVILSCGLVGLVLWHRTGS